MIMVRTELMYCVPMYAPILDPSALYYWQQECIVGMLFVYVACAKSPSNWFYDVTVPRLFGVYHFSVLLYTTDEKHMPARCFTQ